MEPTSRGVSTVAIGPERGRPSATRPGPRHLPASRPRHRADRAGAVACGVGSGLIVAVVAWSVTTPFTGPLASSSGGSVALALALALGVVTTVTTCWRLVAGLRR